MRFNVFLADGILAFSQTTIGCRICKERRISSHLIGRSSE